jgi:hypothetical protein
MVSVALENVRIAPNVARLSISVFVQAFRKCRSVRSDDARRRVDAAPALAPRTSAIDCDCSVTTAWRRGFWRVERLESEAFGVERCSLHIQVRVCGRTFIKIEVGR